MVILFPGSGIVQGGSSNLPGLASLWHVPAQVKALLSQREVFVMPLVQASISLAHISHTSIKLFPGILGLPNTLSTEQGFSTYPAQRTQVYLPMGASFLILGEAAIHYVWVGKHHLAVAAACQRMNDMQSLQEPFLQLSADAQMLGINLSPAQFAPLGFSILFLVLFSRFSDLHVYLWETGD